MGEKIYYITTPIYYANAELHIGHAFTTLAADIMSRFQKSLGKEVWFLTGSDEHGQKVEQSAKLRGIQPIEHTNEIVKKFKELWDKLNISYNDFIRTTEERHKKTVQYVINKLYEKGDIYSDVYKGWYCTPCERFWTNKEVSEKICPDCKRPVEEIEEKNYFFRMSKYQQKLVDYIKSNPTFIQPEHRKNEVLGFLAKPLQDLCISRPKKRLSWGVEIPFDTDYVTYVWVDALTNYISAIGYPYDIDRFQKLWPANCHLVGKDILTTHAVYWSTLLFALELPLPVTIFAHGWWVVAGGKMSKSVGNVVNPLDLIEKYGLDPFRYYLFREMAFGYDANFSEEGFITRYNADLANDFGNLCHRTLSMIKKFRNGIVKKVAIKHTTSKEIENLATHVKAEFINSMQKYAFNEALQKVWDLINKLNKYIDESAPWTLAKNKDFEKLDEVFYTVIESIRFVANLLIPFMPQTMPKFLEQIGVSNQITQISELEWGQLSGEVKCQEPKPIFPRIDTGKLSSSISEAKNDNSKTNNLINNVEQGKITKNDLELEPKQYSITSETITYEDFMRIQLVVAVVQSAEKVEGADKLLKLQVNLGEETRQIVAGIAQYYKPEELIGKQIILVKNLKPAKIRGIESCGMLLATTTDDGKFTIITPEKPAQIGSRVK